MIITSTQNPRIQRVRSLLDKRRQREEEGVFVVEGVRLFEEGLAAGFQPDLVLYSENLSERGMQSVQAARGGEGAPEVIEVSQRVMEAAAGTESPQGVLGVFRRRELPLPARLDFVLIADTIRDPGNLGTLLRTAAAAGVQAALLSPATADAFSPKVLRAGMGAHFRLPVLDLDWEGIRAACKERQPALQILLAEAAEGAALWDQDLRQPLALMVGSEAEGATPGALALADRPISIPMPGRSESLNAAVAASILLFEVVRQRRSGANSGR